MLAGVITVVVRLRAEVAMLRLLVLFGRRWWCPAFASVVVRLLLPTLVVRLDLCGRDHGSGGGFCRFSAHLNASILFLIKRRVSFNFDDADFLYDTGSALGCMNHKVNSVAPLSRLLGR